MAAVISASAISAKGKGGRFGAKGLEVVEGGAAAEVGGGLGDGGEGGSGGAGSPSSLNAIVHNVQRRRFETQDGEAFLEYVMMSSDSTSGPGTSHPQQSTKRPKRSGERERGRSSLESEGGDELDDRTQSADVSELDDRIQSAGVNDQFRTQFNKVNKSVLDLRHTYVPPRKRGLGLAALLCQFAFEYAKKKGLLVSPTCSYVKDTFLRQHTEFQDMVVSSSSSSPPPPPPPPRVGSLSPPPSSGRQGRRARIDGRHDRVEDNITENDNGRSGNGRSRSSRSRSMRPAL